jgi:hypothetical protein
MTSSRSSTSTARSSTSTSPGTAGECEANKCNSRNMRCVGCVRCVGWLGGVEYGIRGWRRVGAGSWFVHDSFICVCLSTAMAVGLVTPEGSRSWGTSTRTRRRRQLIGSMVRLSSLPLEIDVCHLRGEIGLLFTCCVFCLQGEW